MTINNETDIMVVATPEKIANADLSTITSESSPVNNPYTFKITENKSFSAICEEDWSGGGK